MNLTIASITRTSTTGTSATGDPAKRRQHVRRTAILALAGSVTFAACGSDPTPGAAENGIPGIPAVPTISQPQTTLAVTPATTSVAPSTQPLPATAITLSTGVIVDPMPIPGTAVPVATTPTPTTPVTTAAPSPEPEPEPEPSGTPADPTKSAWTIASGRSGLEAESDGVNCLGFYLAMDSASDEACGPWNALDGEFVWTVTRDSEGVFSGVVWEESEGDPFTWFPKLELTEPAAGTWDSLKFRATDIDGGPNEELISGVRYAGTGGYLDLDVIDTIAGVPHVVAHAEGISKGIAFSEANTGVWFWNADYTADDPVCCPSAWSQFLLAAEFGTWTVSEGMAGMPFDAIPQASEF